MDRMDEFTFLDRQGTSKNDSLVKLLFFVFFVFTDEEKKIKEEKK